MSKLEKIAELFPECITETADKDGNLKRAINFELLRQLLSDELLDGREAYEFNFVGKKKAIIEAHKSINKTLRPVLGESRDFNNTQNLYIEGDNLDALKLLAESYLGKVKMIYIDPPYNTGNDFIYRDDFKQTANNFDDAAEIIDDAGNRLFANKESRGRFHSDWCAMIYSRLLIAKHFLSNDGVIFISIDDHEQANLKKICDEVFGEKNFVADLIWNMGTGTTAGHFTRDHEIIFCYAKNKDCLPNFRNFNDDERIIHGALKKISKKNPPVEIIFPAGFEFEGGDAVFTGELGNSEKEFILSDEMRFKDGKLVADTKIRGGFAMRNQIESFIRGEKVFDSKGQLVKRFFFNKSGILFYEKEKSVINPKSVLSEFGSTKNGTNDLRELLGEVNFDFPKPVALIKFLIQVVTAENAIVMDFFSGSATTAQAVMELNAQDGGKRQFIMIQLPESTPENSEARRAGFKTICEIGKERIRRAGDKLKAENPAVDTGFRVFKVDSSNFLEPPKVWTQEILDLYIENILPDRNEYDLLFGTLLEMGLPIHLSFETEEVDGFKVLSYKGGEIVACFDKNLPAEFFRQLATRNAKKIIFRDAAFRNSADKINALEYFKYFAPDTVVKIL